VPARARRLRAAELCAAALGFEAALDLAACIHRDFKFDPKSTSVSTPLAEVMKLKRVCARTSRI